MKSRAGQELQNMDADLDFEGAGFCLVPPKWWGCTCAEYYLALPGMKLKICRAESPMDAPLTTEWIGVSHATDCPFLWLQHKKCSTHVLLLPGLTHQVQPRENEHIWAVFALSAREKRTRLSHKGLAGVCAEVGFHHLGSTQELHHTLLEIGKLHKEKALN